ncbi:unnamed protein product [Linum trigynum]|uniref:Secreted protein n=1 Tax=Linum trigynum TaxID=586398 RepID=A0AAV2CW23_9ROSI
MLLLAPPWLSFCTFSVYSGRHGRRRHADNLDDVEAQLARKVPGQAHDSHTSSWSSRSCGSQAHQLRCKHWP